jgi:hypothetical protein
MGYFRRTLESLDGTDGYPFRMNRETPGADIELIKDIFEESVCLYGNQIIYIRQEYMNEENTFGEHLTKILKDAHNMYAYVEQTEGWDGIGDMFSKFGARVQDEMTMHIPKNFFHDLAFYPKIGDVVYHVVAKQLWQVESVQDDAAPSFHPLSQFISYIIGCKSYMYDHVEASEEIMADTNEHIETIREVFFGDGDIVDNAVETDLEQKNDQIEIDKIDVVDDSEDDPLGFG